jgi:hypothetical protein
MGCGSSIDQNDIALIPKRRQEKKSTYLRLLILNYYSYYAFRVPGNTLRFGPREIRQNYQRLCPFKPPNRKRYKYFVFILGAYGEVRKAVHRITNVIRAVKIISKRETTIEE